MIDLYLQMGFALLLVTGLIFGVGYVAKKNRRQGSLMKIMGYQSLGPKKGMAMVRIGREVLLLGVTATDIKLLKTMDPVEEAADHCPSFEKIVTSMSSGTAESFDATAVGREPENRRPLEKTGTVIMADTKDKLTKLKALKDMLVCN
jgi:flagellar biosynthetic protein FliO